MVSKRQSQQIISGTAATKSAKTNLLKDNASGMAVIEEDISTPEAGGATETRHGTGPSDGISSDTHQHS